MKSLNMVHVNINFVIALIISLAFLGLGLVVFIGSSGMMAEVSGLGQAAKDIVDAPGEVGDVEGYAAIIYGIGYGLGSFVAGVGWLLGIILLTEGVLLIIPTIFSRVFGRKNSKLTGYRVWRSFIHVHYAGFLVIVISIVCSEALSLGAVCVIALLALILIYGIITSYTSIGLVKSEN